MTEDKKISEAPTEAPQIERDVFNLMSEDIQSKFSEMGYDFLQELGYKIPKRPVSVYRAKALARALEVNKRVLVYKGAENRSPNSKGLAYEMLFWWELHELTEDGKEGLFICRSKGLKVVFKAPEKK